MIEDLRDIAKTIEELEGLVRAAHASVRQEERRIRRDIWLNRASTLVVLLLLSLAIVAAAAPVPSTVKAPFQVLNGDRLVFEVLGNPSQFKLYRPSQTVAAGGTVSAGSRPAQIIVWSVDKKTEATMGLVNATEPTIALRQNSNPRVSLSVDENRPTLNLTNKANITIVDLGGSNSGHLELTDAQGHTMVDAGMTGNGVGAVQAYPTGNPGVTLFGLPGTFICGLRCGQ